MHPSDVPFSLLGEAASPTFLASFSIQMGKPFPVILCHVPAVPEYGNILLPPPPLPNSVIPLWVFVLERIGRALIVTLMPCDLKLCDSGPCRIEISVATSSQSLRSCL